MSLARTPRPARPGAGGSTAPGPRARAASRGPVVGVIALQGGFAAHARALERAGASPVELRAAPALDRVDALILPGGESTVIGALLDELGIAAALGARAHAGLPVLGTCAGAILMARDCEESGARGLGLIDATVRRNAYGRQAESFVAPVDTTQPGDPLYGVFIRAPAFTRIGPGVEVLGRLDAERRPPPGAPHARAASNTAASSAVWLRQGAHLACTFHPELGGDLRVHHALLASLGRPSGVEEAAR